MGMFSGIPKGLSLCALLLQFKMLVVLACLPVAAPVETCLGKELETEVVVVNLVGEVPVAVAVSFLNLSIFYFESITLELTALKPTNGIRAVNI